MSDQPEKRAGASSCSTSFCGVLCCALVCATIAFLAYLFVSPHSEATRRLWIPIVVETNGSQSILGETRQLEFWTPSATTKDYLQKAGEKVSAKDKWQIISNDDMVAQFGAVLHSSQDVFGYRRVEVWGQGRTSFKSGWWWTMNVTTNYSAADLARTYQKFWKVPQPVLVEVIDNRGTSDK